MLRSVSRAALAAVGVVLLAEVVFGRGHSNSLLGIPYWDGIGRGYLINGAVIGMLYGLVGFGLILIYRAARIINFAVAAMGSFPALAGLLLVVGRGWPYWAGVLVMLAGSVVVGVLIEAFMLRRFANRPRLIVTVVTIGVGYLLTFLESYEPSWLAGQDLAPVSFPSPFTHFTYNSNGFVLNGDHLAVVVVAGIACLGLASLLRYTRIGIAIRASAENSDRAVLLGIPVQRVTTTVWVIATVLAGTAAFLRGPVIGLPVGTGVTPVVLLYGLAAAVIARMESLPVALGAGMGLGVMEQGATFTSHPDLATGLVLPVVLVALLVRRRTFVRALDSGVSSFRVLQEHRPIPLELRGLREVRVVRGLGAAAVAGLALGAPWLVGTSRADHASFIVICAMLAVSMVVLSGWAGQISLGNWAFAGIGAAVAGSLASRADSDFFVSVALAGVAGAVVAVLIGVPALRVQGLFLAVVTLAFAATVQGIVLNRDFLGSVLPTYDVSIPRPVLWSRVDTSSGTAFYYVCLTGLVLAALMARALRTSRSGRLFIGVRDNVRAAQAYGVSATVTRLSAFAVSGFLAAVAGALFVYQQGTLDTSSFVVDFSIEVFVFSVIGGLSGVGPAIAGAVMFEGLKLLQPLQHLFGFNSTTEFIDTFFIHGSALFVLTFAPGGIGSGWYGLRDRWLRSVARRHELLVPSLLADRDVAVTTGRSAVAPMVMSEDAVLVCQGVDAGYDGVQVLFGVDLEVRRGEILALLGTNGAGKSTLLRVVSGLLPATAGTVTFLGRDVTKLGPVGMAKLKVVQVPGGRGVFPTLTVAEHFTAAAWLLRDDPELEERREHVLTLFPRLRERSDQLAGNLSGGEQQQLALGMAFLAKPDLLIIDELSLGLAPTIVEQLLVLVREINAAGAAVVLVEQSVNVALTLADRAYFMEKGEVRFEGPTAELLERDDIVRSVFLEGAGRPTTAVARAERGTVPVEERSVVLEAQALSVSFGGIRAVHDVSLVLREAEILGLIGPNGAGKTTLFDLLSGFLPPVSGRVWLLGEDVTRWSPDARARVGLGRSFQDARIFPSLTVAENIALSLERHLEVRDHLASGLGLPAAREVEEDIAWTVADLVELMQLGAFRDKFVSELSTGSRRVVDLAMAIAHDPTVLVLDEPSSGIAQRETEALGPLLERIRVETGCAMLVIEHDMPLITAVSDRLIALELGTVIAEGAPLDVIHDPQVVASYLGTGAGAHISRSGVLA
ncbi:MAG: Phosphonate-transporting ATPase [Frankiales bacterium]|nr:Phosphonate-transporting ATPase [Frankiales bacterium]